MPKPVPTVDRLRQLLDYDPLTGFLIWREDRNWKTKAGSLAGSVATTGYWDICVDGSLIRAHRIAWAITYGDWPSQVDHIDGNRSNNAITNLRLATTAENQCNRGAQRSNTSGIKGVSWHSRSGKWRATIRTRERRLYLGSYSSREEAAAVYASAATKHHGNFARTS